ncbi:sigma 54-interacting transcriptional regulator [Flavitalea sp.]|nr:sigma 54-interacting transcriptional regulator [Flavitalea sp.]
MKKVGNSENKKNHQAKSPSDQSYINTLQGKLDAYEKEKSILLALSNDITKVREKDDLINLFSSRLKGLYYFTHAVVSLIDKQSQTYYPFLINPEALPIKHQKELPSLLRMRFPMTDPFILQVLDSERPVSFLLEEIIDKPGIPAFIKVNYECGIRKAMVAILKNKMESIGYVIIYSDRMDSFPDDFNRVLYGIVPHLSNAVSNIIINEEIRYKELVNEILLSLSNDMVTVRSRTDLLNVINFSLRKLIYFTHCIMTGLNESGETYYAFILDPESRAKNFSEYAEMLSIANPVQDGIYDVASLSNKPVVINTATVDLTKAPLWLKLNYEAGAKEMMIKVLPGEGKPKHSIILFSDRTNNFDEKAIHIIERISSQLATAVSNISANEEILKKERDKTYLLNFSHEIAAVRTIEDLSNAIYNSLKKLGLVKAYFIRTINDDRTTMSSFMNDKDFIYKDNVAFKELLETKIPINVGITAKVLSGNVPLLIDFVDEISQGNTDPFIECWKQLGAQKAAFRKIVGTPLRIGNIDLGILWVITDRINMTILEGISTQISLAISNIIAYEEIASREEEKSILLSLSDEIASLRNRNDLFKVVNDRIKKLFSIEQFGIAKINEDRETHSAFMMDMGDSVSNQEDFAEVTSIKYSITDKAFAAVMYSDDPVILDVDRLSKETDVPKYVTFWKAVGFRKLLCLMLKVGGNPVGTIFFNIPPEQIVSVKDNLLKAVCAQLAVAVSNILANEQVLAYKQMLEIENDHLKEQIKTIYNFSDIIGSGPEMQKVYRLMTLVAESNSTVLLLGETGTGKELIARAIHNASPRKEKLMVKVNCAALPANLIESELFGHERGSFTGAIDRRIGKFELANNGTLFLDEIGEMPLETQVKLLRVIQEREFERVGGKTTIKVNVRIIAATNRKLDEEVNSHRFRPDLYYRLNVFPINLPSLRDRLEDIEPLANFFVERYSRITGRKVTSISAKVNKELKSYSWPGNVRELEHLIERSILLTEGNVLKEIQLPVKNKIKSDDADISPKGLQEIESSYIIEVLKKCKGKISGIGGAADVLGIPATTLHSKMKKLGVSKPDYFQNQNKESV